MTPCGCAQQDLSPRMSLEVQLRRMKKFTSLTDGSLIHSKSRRATARAAWELKVRQYASRDSCCWLRALEQIPPSLRRGSGRDIVAFVYKCLIRKLEYFLTSIRFDPDVDSRFTRYPVLSIGKCTCEKAGSSGRGLITNTENMIYNIGIGSQDR